MNVAVTFQYQRDYSETKNKQKHHPICYYNKLFQTSVGCVDASITDWPSSFFIVDGLGVRRDYKMAIKFFNLASQTGKDINAVRSQFRLRV